MRVLIATDAFGSTLGAVQAAAAMAEGWSLGAPHDEVVQLPLCDGGPGFLDVLQRAVGGTMVATTVSDPLGRPVPAAVLVDSARGVAYVEMAQAIGLHLLGADERDPTLTSTWGGGQLLETALGERTRRIVVGVGRGTGAGATNDAGAGLLAALGAGPASVLARGGLALRHAAPDAVLGLAAVVDRFAQNEIHLATDDETPLLGLSGTSAVDAPRKGATAEQAHQLEGALGRFTEVVGRALGAPTDLLSGAPRRLDRQSGAGAAGGLGYALLALGARRVSAVAEVLRVCRFGELAAQSDLVVTGAGLVDWSTLRGSVVSSVAAATRETGPA
ncbi:MAG: glycerate kinase, partial [Dermatophilaceae bacterium]